jgi:flagellar motor switch/type III secretory pathway protein FliN
VVAASAKPDEWGALSEIPCELSLELNIPHMKVEDILQLAPGRIVNSGWRTNRDLPLRINGRLLAWVELDGTGNRVSVRLTEFAWEQKG